MNALPVFVLLLAVCSVNAIADNTCTGLEKCYKIIEVAKSEAKLSDICKSLNQGEVCVDVIKKNNKCPALVGRLGIAEIKLDELDLSTGCDGQCGKAVDACLSDLVSQIKPVATKYNTDVCGDVTKAMKCIEDLKPGASNCSGDVTKVMSSYAQKMKDEHFSDMCGPDGKADTPCLKTFSKCEADLAEGQKAKQLDQGCKAIEAYIECMNGNPCKDYLKNIYLNTKTSLETAETKEKCPTVGTCEERLNNCAKRPQEEIDRVENSGDKKTTMDKEACKILNDAIGCFNSVRKDEICFASKGLTNQVEDKLKQGYVDNKCGAAAIIVSTTLIVLAAVASSFKNLFA